mmetsp:Transcript_119478/g.381190  ORF Transcript_119478/g.381190 Transcript_119478/m.381190 type:complete len:182 (+) Transcript_119478:2919-3464(+)
MSPARKFSTSRSRRESAARAARRPAVAALPQGADRSVDRLLLATAGGELVRYARLSLGSANATWERQWRSGPISTLRKNANIAIDASESGRLLLVRGEGGLAGRKARPVVEVRATNSLEVVDRFLLPSIVSHDHREHLVGACLEDDHGGNSALLLYDGRLETSSVVGAVEKPRLVRISLHK